MSAPSSSTDVARRGQWRSLEESGGAPDEFPAGSADWEAGLNRREFMALAAASLALAGGGCTRQPQEAIVPYVKQPEGLEVGRPLFYATAMALGGQVHGLLVKSREGRPVKIEGNPDHPTTLGLSTVHMQGALLDLYDPTRAQTVQHRGEPATWSDFLGALLAQTPRWRENEGAGLRLLSTEVNSPTLRAQIDRLLARYPKAKWHRHDAAFPVRSTETIHRFERADVVVALDADFLGAGGMELRAAHHFSLRRRKEKGMNRLYVVESMPSITGAMADHRRALAPREIANFASALEQAVRENGAAGGDHWAGAVARDLLKHRGRSIVLASPYQPELQAVARAINEALGNIGQTIEYHDEASPTQAGTLPELAREMTAGAVEALCILGGNPVFTASADVDFSQALAKVPFSVYLGSHADETATRCAWHLPESHFLESWSDARSAEGLESIVQPLVEPLYASVSAHELLAALTLGLPGTAYEIIRTSWQERHATHGDFETLWRRTLHDGVAPAQELKAATAATSAAPNPTPPGQGLELIFRPDPHLLDGRFRTNGWLQELPRPMTKLTWENAAHLSPRTAQAQSLHHGEIVELQYRGRMLRAPVWILPGHADGCVTIHLGHGGNGCAGFNAFLLQTSDAPWGSAGLQIRSTGGSHHFATTQAHQEMAGREPVRVDEPGRKSEHEAPPRADETLYEPYRYTRPAWGMVIDLGTCIGCSVCTIACQAENNIPVVGREQVLRGREMHWIRVDRYYEGDAHAPTILHQPVPCMHCENAPCEAVCPVAATVHDHDGLNLMVYNRCIGTRYCSNNCPYKVRRFNFLQYTDEKSPSLKMGRNPEVSVRMRGVMEKCTYCVQRIAVVRIEADKENRQIRDGEVVPACAQACPADAIVFGDINDPSSRVAGMREDPRHYALLAELNTRPRTTYLAKTRNPNPEVPA